jgi:hypothetical protein
VRSTTFNSYLYQAFADDDYLQAFVSAYNAATQTFITWFGAIGLPYYPALNGDLLNWVIQGLYGLQRTSLASPASTALGPLNTVVLNSLVLNGYIPSSQIVYDITDDILKRALTWDFFKGDGKRFCTRWLKRRVMRFLVGTNGIDPQPGQSGFVIGTETTTAIGVAIIGVNELTVTINQTTLSSQVSINPIVITLFQAAFEGGYLDLPVQYTNLVVDVIT